MTATDIDLDALIDALAARAAARARPLTNAAGDDVSQLAAAGLVTVNPGDLITSQWGNLTYGQSNLTFASVADRNSQWTSAPEGAQCVTLDTNSPWIYRAGAWHARPMGVVGSTMGPVSQVNCAATATTIMSLTAPVVAGRVYRLTAQAWGLQQTTAAATPGPYFALSGATNIDSAQARFAQFATLAANTYLPGTGVWRYTPAATGSQTWTLVGTTPAGTLMVAANQCLLLLEDIGG